MNVIHIISATANPDTIAYATEICESLTERGHSVAAITRRNSAAATATLRSSIATGYLPLRGAFDILSPRMLAHTLDRINSAVAVHTHSVRDTATALRARRLMRRPGSTRIIYTAHTPGEIKRPGDIEGVDAILFNTPTEVAANTTGINTEIHTVVPCPKPKELPERKPHDGFLCAFIGQITPEKGLDILVKALANDPAKDVALSVFGEGDSRNVMPVVRLSRGTGTDSRIEWLGGRYDIDAILAETDAAIFPDTAGNPSPLPLLRCMASGIPVIRTDTECRRGITTDGKDSLVVPTSDPDTLAEAIGRLAADSELRKKLSENAQDTIAKRYSHDTYIDTLLNIYRGTQR